MTHGLSLLAETELETVWRLETHWAWPPWLTALLVAGAAAIVLVAYRYEASPARGAYRALLAALRMATLLLLLLMLSEAIYSGARTGKARMAVLVDRSESMQRADVVLPDADEAITRLDFARELLTTNNGALLDEITKQYDLECYWVDNSLVRAADTVEGTLEALRANDSPGDPTTSRLGNAVESLLSSPATTPLQGVVLLTDGQNTAGRSLNEAADVARRLGVPIYAVGLGSEQAPPEAQLTDLLADETAFVDDIVKFEAKLRTRGLDGASVRVDLYWEGSATPVASETLTIDSERPEVPVRLLHRPTKTGEQRYRLVATMIEMPEEVRGAEPSVLLHTLSVRDDKVRVLLAAGYPNYEFRYLKHLLERDHTINLSTLIQESDFEYAESDLTALARFPIRYEELKDYDTLVLIDLDPTLLPRSVWKSVARYVSEDGGGLALVAGPRSLPAGYRGISRFAALLPTESKTVLPGGWAEASGYRVTPTELGQRNAPLQLADTPSDSDQVWRNLPEMYWRAEIGSPKQTAQVLAHQPQAGGAPLIVTHYYGAGRVLLHAFDSSWRWRRQIGDVFFARYWVQTIRSLARGKLHATGKEGELIATKPQYEYGEPVRLRLHRQTQTEGEAPVVLLQSPGRPERRLELQPGAGGRGRFQATLSDLSPGRYRAVVATKGDAAPLATDFQVVAPVGESSHPEMNREVLSAIAQRSRGRFLTADEADQLAEALPPARREAIENLPPIELWNRWPLLLAICACLCAEWVLRKKRSML